MNLFNLFIDCFVTTNFCSKWIVESLITLFLSAYFILYFLLLFVIFYSSIESFSSDSVHWRLELDGPIYWYRCNIVVFVVDVDVVVVV